MSAIIGVGACKSLILNGEMSEWLKEHAWKACVGETLPRVRIPLSPPIHKRLNTRTYLIRVALPRVGPLEICALLAFFALDQARSSLALHRVTLDAAAKKPGARLGSSADAQ